MACQPRCWVLQLVIGLKTTRPVALIPLFLLQTVVSYHQVSAKFNNEAIWSNFYTFWIGCFETATVCHTEYHGIWIVKYSLVDDRHTDETTNDLMVEYADENQEVVAAWNSVEKLLDIVTVFGSIQKF